MADLSLSKGKFLQIKSVRERALHPPWPSLRSASFPHPFEKVSGREHATPGRCKHNPNTDTVILAAAAFPPRHSRAVQAPPPLLGNEATAAFLGRIRNPII